MNAKWANALIRHREAERGVCVLGGHGRANLFFPMLTYPKPASVASVVLQRPRRVLPLADVRSVGE